MNLRFTNRDRLAIALILIAICICGLFLSWRRWNQAAVSAEAAASEHGMVLSQIRRLNELRRERELFDDRPRPRSEIVEPFKAQMHAAGLAPDSLTQVSIPDSQLITGTPYERQQGSMTVDRVRVPDLVRLLAAWSKSQPLWTLRSVRLEKSAASARSNSSGGTTPGGSADVDDRYTAFLTIENVHVASAAAQVPAPKKLTGSAP